MVRVDLVRFNRDRATGPSMTRTSVSLLDRLKAAGPDASDWNRLQGIFFSLNDVLQSKSRILKRLREEAGDLLG